MSKGLEAWKRLNEHDSNDESYWYGEQFNKDKETIEKELEALEIIKEKGLHVGYLKTWLAKSTYSEYTGEHEGTIYELTQEQFNLLKEVLL